MKNKKTSPWMEKWLRVSGNKRLFLQEGLILDISEKILTVMQETGITRMELADRLGKSRPYVSQLLDGSRNMTLRTLSDICFALNRTPEVSFNFDETDVSIEGFILAGTSPWEGDLESNIRNIWSRHESDEKVSKMEAAEIKLSESMEEMGEIAA